MPLRFVLDEHLRGGGLWQAILQQKALGIYSLDVVRVGDPADLPLGTPDPAILAWGERAGRILVSPDNSSLPAHLAWHLGTGQHSPGDFLIRPRVTIAGVLFALQLAEHAGDPRSFQDRIEYIP